MRRLGDQRGWAMVTAMGVMSVMSVVSLVVLAATSSLQQRTGSERRSESAFNVAEAALNTQLTIVGRRWPAAVASQHPVACVRGVPRAAADIPRCPDDAALAATFAGGDLRASSTWQITVRDDLATAATVYSRAVVDATPCAVTGGLAPCRWDSNRNGILWLRAEATVGGRKRVLVSQVRQLQTRLGFPRNTLVAHRFTTSNRGLKTIADLKGCNAKHKPSASCNATEPGPIAVRCTTSTPAVATDACLGYRSGQVAPNVTAQGHTAAILPAGGLDQLRAAAIQNGTYFTSCPSAAQLAGPVVFIEGASCAYTANGVINSPAVPGVLVVERGTLSLSGTLDFYGVIYMANGLPSPQDAGNLLTLGGNVYVQGAIFVEGMGGVLAGASGVNLSFDPNVLSNVTVPGGGVSMIPNSFRELPADG